MDIEPNPLSGNVRSNKTMWITLETDTKGRLLIRTLNGFNIIEDPIKAQEVLKAIKTLAGL